MCVWMWEWYHRVKHVGAFVPSLHYLVMFILDIVFNKLFDDDDDDDISCRMVALSIMVIMIMMMMMMIKGETGQNMIFS